jgi:hypothetical protein
VPYPWRRILLKEPRKHHASELAGDRPSSAWCFRALSRAKTAAGQAYVEFVLVLPILILLAVAVGDFGRVYASGVAVEDAAREAADYAAFDDVSASHFEEPVPGTVDAKDSTRFEALRRACAAVSSLPDFSQAAGTCSDPTARCSVAAGSFCQMVIEDHRANQPWASTCGIDPTQMDVTCGWSVHVTITFDFHTAIDFPGLPTTVNLVRESMYAISALPAGVPPGP